MESTTLLPQKPNTTVNMDKEFKDINAHLSNISTREALMIVAICLVGVVTGVNLILTILQHRKKTKHDGIPQSIVIKPNSSSGKGEKSEQTSLAMESKDVLPSKSMKMKVAIAPGTRSNRKPKSESVKFPKEGGNADTSYSKVETVGNGSASQSLKKDKEATTSGSVETISINADANANEAKDHRVMVISPSQSRKAIAESKPQENNMMNITLTSDPPGSAGSSFSNPHNNDKNNELIVVPTGQFAARSKASASTDSMTSFTVPEENRTSMTSLTKNEPVPSAQPSTPTATTLSGSKAASSISSPLISPKKSRENNKIVFPPPTPIAPPVLALSSTPSGASAPTAKPNTPPIQGSMANVLKTPTKPEQPDPKTPTRAP